MPNAARNTALANALKQIDANFGKNTVMRLGERKSANDIEVISTGSIGLDSALGIGGLPRGRIVEIYGMESSGKTTLALHVIAEAQKQSLNCVFIDAEHAIDPEYARGLGVDLDNLYITQPDSGEAALEIADTLTRSGGVDVIVVDSVAALVPKAEIDGEMGDAHMALQARLMSQALRKLTANLSKNKTMIIFINQIRSKVGVVFGSPDVTTGGNALKFYASIRMEIRKTGQVKAPGAGEEIVGNLVRVKVSKNKLSSPFRLADFELTYGKGINLTGEIVDLGLAHGLLVKSGAWFKIEDAELVKRLNAALSSEGRAHIKHTASDSASDIVEAPSVGARKGKKGKKAGSDGQTEVLQQPPPIAASVESTPDAPGVHITAGEPFAQGRERAKQFFDQHPAAAKVMTAAVRAALAQKSSAASPVSVAPRPPIALVDDVLAHPSGETTTELEDAVEDPA